MELNQSAAAEFIQVWATRQLDHRYSRGLDGMGNQPAVLCVLFCTAILSYESPSAC